MVQFGYRFLVHSFLQVGSAEPEACLDEFRIQLYRLLVLLDCSVVLSAKVQDVSDPGVDGERKRVECLGMAHLGYGLVESSLRFQEVGVKLVGRSVAGVEL